MNKLVQKNVNRKIVIKKKNNQKLNLLYHLNLFIIFGIILLKAIDVVYTYINVSKYGYNIEGNPLFQYISSNIFITLVISFFPIVLGFLLNYYFKKDKLVLVVLSIVLISCFVFLFYVVYSNIQIIKLWE